MRLPCTSCFFVFREIHVFFDFLLRLVFFFNCLEIEVFFDFLVISFLFAVLRFVFFDFLEISGEPYFNEHAAKSEKKFTRPVGF